MNENAVDKVTRDHIDKLIMDGSVTIGNKDNPRDLGIYLRSGKFSAFESALHQQIAS